MRKAKNCSWGVRVLRPRYLEIEGLQSFKDMQAIDFDRLGETGLFGIFGPTGSGKSTILDAVTLALYGNVQRANRGTQGILNVSSDIMRVSFTFDLAKAGERKTYKVERVYRRKKDSENSIESRAARLIELRPEGDVVIADKQSEVNEAVIELIGLHFDDFTHSVVLPQNKFQEFLLAPKAEKTKMLERIFYLGEYGRKLTEKVNRKLGQIKNKLSGIEGALSVLGDISETSLKEAEAALAAETEKRRNIDRALKASEAEYSSAKEVWELSMELQETVRKQEEQLSMAAEINAMRERCKRAMAAQSLKDRIDDLAKAEAELKKTEEELEKLETDLCELGKRLESGMKELEEASALRQARIPALVEYKTKLANALLKKDELEKLEEILRKLRSDYKILKDKVDQWDEKIAALKASLEGALEKAAGQKSRVEALKVDAAYRDKVQRGAALEEELERSRKLREQNESRYQELSGIISVQEQELEALEKKGSELFDEMRKSGAACEQHMKIKQWDRNDIIKAEARYYSIKSVSDGLKQKYREIEQLKLKESEYDGQLEALMHKLDGLRTEKENKQGELDNARNLLAAKKQEQERNAAFMLAQSLKENEPCPVCGSTEHPKPAAHWDGMDAEAGTETIKELQTLIDNLDMQCRSIEKESIKLSEQYSNFASLKEDVAANIKSRQEELDELLGRLPDDCRGLQLDQVEGALEKISQEKQEMLKAIEAWEAKLAELEEMQKKAAEEHNRCQVEISGKRSQLEANKKHLEELKKACTEAEEDCRARQEAYNDAVRALGISNMRKELQKIQSNDREAENLYKELQNLEKNIEDLRKEIEKAEEARKHDNEMLSENIAEGRGYKYRKEEMEKELRLLLGDKDIETEIAKTEEEMAALAGREKEAQEFVNKVREEYEKAVKDKKVLEKQRDIFGAKLKSDSEKLEKELKEKGFAGLEEVAEAFMAKESIEQQEKAIKEYEEDVAKTQAHKTMIEKKLAGRSITEELWQEISSRYEELKLRKENSIAAYENARSRYETIRANYERWLSLGKELKEYSKKREHLEMIKNLLKGNGFIEYISEERLRYVAREASETLGFLTRHKYGLELDPENGFVIRDNSNGGICRLVTSLSGGETFLTSLALALALSSQIQLKGQSPLEFFFLDEGFGTLDSSLLDTVIDALERLSTRDRVIGLISHVPELRCRITRRLVVEPPAANGSGSRVYIEKA